MSIAREIVGYAIQAGSSDIHLEEGSPIAIRINSDITVLPNILKPTDMDRLLSEIVWLMLKIDVWFEFRFLGF